MRHGREIVYPVLCLCENRGYKMEEEVVDGGASRQHDDEKQDKNREREG